MTGHVRKRGTTWTYVIDVGRDEDGKRKQKWSGGFRTKKDAQAALNEAIGRMAQGTYIEPTKQTVAEFLHEWLPAIRATVRPNTRYSYEINIEGAVLPRIGTIRLKQLTPAHLNVLYAELLESGRKDGKGGLSPRSVRYIHTILRKAFQDAVRWGRLLRNPCDQADPPRQKRPEMKTWTAPEVRRFLAQADGHRLHAAFFLAITTGMRRGELLGLRWADVDLEAGRLSIQQTLVAVGYEIQISEPKTSKSRRSIAIDPATIASLKAHRIRQAQEKLAWGPAYQDNGLVFTKEDGSPVHPQSLTVAFKHQAKMAGLPALRLHDLRHTYATLALAAGVHPKVVSERLGHSSITITLDTYSHAIPALQEEAAAKVASLILG